MSRFTTVVVLAGLAIGAPAAITATAAAKSNPNLWRNKADTVTCGVEIHASNKPASRNCATRQVSRRPRIRIRTWATLVSSISPRPARRSCSA